MRFALVNPPWTFQGSIYFGCQDPHFPLELGYARSLLEREGHETAIIDGHLEGLSLVGVREQVQAFGPEAIVVTTAPNYLFWRCPPPELKIPMATVAALRDLDAAVIAVGPHASATPGATVKKLGVDLVIRGEFEEVLPTLAGLPRNAWHSNPSVYPQEVSDLPADSRSHVADLTALPPLSWPLGFVQRHQHHHHRFDAAPKGPGAEIESSRGCPFHCSFCARENFRRSYRRRSLPVILEELDGLIRQGVEYVYFIDEIFWPRAELLEALVGRKIKFGIQTRIELWDRGMLQLLGAAGCVSIEAGVESLEESGRRLLKRETPASLEAITERLVTAKNFVPFVQANLMDIKIDAPDKVAAWRRHLQNHGVWANQPVPVFYYPGSPGYREKWGEPDNLAWERAHQDYLQSCRAFSDIQDQHPLPLSHLEARSVC